MGGAHALAQSAQIGDAILWLGVLLGVVVAGALVIFAMRRRLSETDAPEGDPLDLSVLRRMHAAGQLSDAEFEAARAAVVARHGGSEATPSVSPLDPSLKRARPGVDLAGDPLPRPGATGRGPRRTDPRDPGGQGPENTGP